MDIPKVVQIEISRASDFFNGASETVIALCEDGTLWRLVDISSEHDRFHKFRWRQIPLEKAD